MTKNVVGIDISNRAVRAIEISDANKPHPSVVRYGSLALPEGAVSRGEVLEPTTVATALRQLWSTAGFTSKDVVLGVGNHRVLARDLTVPKMSIERIRESLPYQVQEMLPVPVEDALLDFYPISEGTSDQGPTVNGLLVAAVKQSVVGNVRAVELAGLNPLNVDLIPFALSRVFLRGLHSSGTVAILDIGANTSTIVIAKDGVPQFVRIISAGGADVTAALQAEFGIEAATAELSKRQLGLATVGVPVESRPLVEVIYRVAGELVNSIRNTLNYYAGSRPQEVLKQIVLTGGGGHMVGFAQALAENAHIPVVIGDPFENIDTNKNFTAQLAGAENDDVVVALGLALGSAA